MSSCEKFPSTDNAHVRTVIIFYPLLPPSLITQEVFDKYDTIILDTINLSLSKSVITITESLDIMQVTDSPAAREESHCSIAEHSSIVDDSNNAATSEIGSPTPEIISSRSHHSLYDADMSCDDGIMDTDSPAVIRDAEKGIGSTCTGIQELANGYCIVKTRDHQLQVTSMDYPDLFQCDQCMLEQ